MKTAILAITLLCAAVGMGQTNKQVKHAPPCSAKESAVASTDGKSYCVAKPEIVSMQLVLDPVQAKYPGNQHVKECGPKNHDNACFDPKLPHIVNHLYKVQPNCEAEERVKCARLDGYFVPIGKPVLEDKAPKPVLGDETQGYQVVSPKELASAPMFGTINSIAACMTDGQKDCVDVMCTGRLAGGEGCPGTSSKPIQLQDCKIVSSTGNQPAYQDMSEIYDCNGRRVELHGRWSMTVEYGTLYRTEMGRVSPKTEGATLFDRDFFKWCRKDDLQVELCGFLDSKDSAPYAPKSSMIPWYPNPKDYPNVPQGVGR